SAAVRTGMIGATIVRIFNTYGPRMRQDDGRVVPTFIMQALRGEALTVFGDGGQSRSFMYVDDLVDALIRVARLEPSQEPLVLNVGNPEETTIAALAATVSSLVGTPPLVEQKTLPRDDPARRRPEISRARGLLHWEPRTSLVDGLRATIEHFRDQVYAMA
ncbi:MAG: NAD-dependent epimerase/dehydratase family protein, partial [Candidatus Eremiobacteraeota bacterium]|nr:NAD-dependent epimerase/dehydratase family protein [Candidatus Eremiobacteraeota bacterium]